MSRLATKLNVFVRLSDDERTCLDGLEAERIRIRRGGELVHEGQVGHKAYILQFGWACSFKLLPDGGRQIIRFPIGGDLMGLRGLLLRTSDHSFSALTDIVVSSVEATRLAGVFDQFPRLGAAILWAASREEAMVVEHLVSVGRRSAVERTAHFFLELSERLRLVGLGTQEQFKCPLNQYVLADALGLSAIHVNRVLRTLRERRFMTLRDRIVHIHDPDGMKMLAGYQEIEGRIFDTSGSKRIRAEAN
jgi:CRP-like cAMP-binding protein